MLDATNFATRLSDLNFSQKTHASSVVLRVPGQFLWSLGLVAHLSRLYGQLHASTKFHLYTPSDEQPMPPAQDLLPYPQRSCLALAFFIHTPSPWSFSGPPWMACVARQTFPESRAVVAAPVNNRSMVQENGNQLKSAHLSPRKMVVSPKVIYINKDMSWPLHFL